MRQNFRGEIPVGIWGGMTNGLGPLAGSVWRAVTGAEGATVLGN